MITPHADALVVRRADTGVESVSHAGSVMHTVTRKVVAASSPIIGEGVVVATTITAGGLQANHGETLVEHPLKK